MGVTLILAEDVEGEALWDLHLPAWTGWLEISGQWRTESVTVGAMGASASRTLWLGLDYTAARNGLEMAGVAITPDLWSEIRAIETGAIEELNRVR